ncbi:neutral/alkaline non-lysosomal ceramidase N-terminal domain-containing protein [Myxococcota bacterium]|nr:neutral/alkaline non-lysosomal ceramidase N-terminal domain-containing protein [Myxococcota bacterium]
MSLPSTLLALSLLACKDKAGDDTGPAADGGATDGGATEAWSPDLLCPGDAACPDADGPLSVGASKVSITPTCFESWEDLDGNAEWDDDAEPFLDCGCDRLCAGDEGWTAPDEGEGDGEFQAVWMAGFQNSRPAQGVHDDLWARAIVFDQGGTRIALVVVDLVGFFHPDVQGARALVSAAGLDVDHVVVSSTHGHEGPDTMGLWGPTETRSGVDPDYISAVQQAVAQAVTQAVADLRPVARFQVGAVDVSTYHEQGVYNIITDLRDPIVIDEQMNGAAFWDAEGNVIASLAHFGDHPESVADENLLITSDFPHKLRETMEAGSTWSSRSRPGLGGTAIFVNGAVGGMMTGLRVDVHDPDGNVWSDYTHERTEVMGTLMGEMALDAIEGGAEVSAPTLRLVGKRFRLPVENWGFQVLFLTGIVDRELFDYDPEEIIDEENVPWIETELNLLTVGPLTLLTCPGELFPEVNIGGYDGSHVGSAEAWLVDPENVNPPDLSQAPAGPYLKERVGAEHVWLVGLGNDQLGYMLPTYDFELHPTNPWFDEAEGDHYEETNSLSSQAVPLYEAQVDALLGWIAANPG